LTILLLLLLPFLAVAQQPGLGINAGATYPVVRGVVTVNDMPARDTTLAHSGLPGLQIGSYYVLPIDEQWAVQGEVGYELLRFRSHTRLFDKGNINDFKLGLLLTYSPLDRWHIIGGIEVAYRTNSASGSTLTGQLNGTKVASGGYWQGMMGTRFSFRNGVRLECRMLIPRIASVTRVFIGQPINNELLVEQLQGFSLSIGWPVFRAY
jgi:hypothetical protein